MNVKSEIKLIGIAIIMITIIAEGQDNIEIPLAASPDLTRSPYEWKYDNAGRSVQQTTDGGYIITGYTRISDRSNYNALLIKTKSDGNVEWKKNFGGADEDRGMDSLQTSDGGYIIAGYTKSKGNGNEDVWIIKTDSKGETIWDRTFGGPNDDRGLSVDKTRDGGYIISGTTASFGAGNYDVWLIKTDSRGNKIWDKTFGGQGSDGGVSIQTLEDDGYILTGWTEHTNIADRNVFLIKTDSNGNQIWEKSFGELGNCEGNSIRQTTDGGYIIAGGIEVGTDKKMDALLIKTDSEGKIVWNNIFGGEGRDEGYFAFQTIDEGYIIIGDNSTTALNKCKIALIKTNSMGEESWNKTFGGHNRLNK
jgi:hypothetical protein